jgi:hypothetical protein
MTDVSMLVANPAYGTIPDYAANWTTGAYHGTVVWGWPLVTHHYHSILILGDDGCGFGKAIVEVQRHC